MKIKLLLFAFLLTSHCFSQLGLITKIPDKDERHAKKIEKSPAKDDILLVEKAIANANASLEKYPDVNYFATSTERHALLTDPCEKIKNGIVSIKSKDPKWDLEEYETSLKLYEQKLVEIAPKFEDTKKASALVDSVLVRYKNVQAMWQGLKFGDIKCDDLLTNVALYYSDRCPCADKFHNFYVKTVDIKRTQNEIKEIGRINPELLGLDNYQKSNILDWKKKYVDEFSAFKKQYIDETDKFIAELKANSKDREYQATGVLKFQRKKLETLKEIDPADQNLINEIKKIDDCIAYLREAQLKNNMVTPERAQKIIFLTADVDKDKFETDAVKATSWNIENPLYFRWFMDKPDMATYCALEGAPEVQDPHEYTGDKHIIYINGTKFFEGIFMSHDGGSKIFYNSLTAREEYDSKNDFARDLITEMGKKLKAGTYEMKVEIYLAYRKSKSDRLTNFAAQPTATGQINVVITPAALAKLKKEIDNCAPPAGMVDANLSAQMISAFKQRSADDGGWEETPKRAVIIDKNWTINQNKRTGITTSRSIEAWVFSVRKDGTCKRQNFIFEQKHISNGNFGALVLSGIGDPYDMSCECMNK
ncbi:MAG TPA: hypothetical protein VD905_21620 [Flavobacteriales bacterium]|nr:hypothetical protein [Flavobacteriales bacterium]